MKIFQKDIDETIKVSEIINKIDKMDVAYANSESDVIFQRQPFLISLILGYRLDLKMAEVEEVTKIIFIIWEYFKDNQKVNRKKITENQFEKIQHRNIYMLQYFEGEPGEEAKSHFVASDLDQFNSKVLLASLFFRFDTQDVFMQMTAETKAILLIGMKSLIECFEEIKKS
jgi:hypothetical protein